MKKKINNFGWKYSKVSKYQDQRNKRRNLILMLFVVIVLYIGIMLLALKPYEIEGDNVEVIQIVKYDSKMAVEGKMRARMNVIDTYENSNNGSEPVYKIEVDGIASWYDYMLDEEEWSKEHDTCATRGWNRYGTLKVTNLDNGKSVECYVNDDGPRDCEYRYAYRLDEPGECQERLIDLSSHAFEQIADLELGLINVRVEEIIKPSL